MPSRSRSSNHHHRHSRHVTSSISTSSGTLDVLLVMSITASLIRTEETETMAERRREIGTEVKENIGPEIGTEIGTGVEIEIETEIGLGTEEETAAQDIAIHSAVAAAVAAGIETKRGANSNSVNLNSYVRRTMLILSSRLFTMTVVLTENLYIFKLSVL